MSVPAALAKVVGRRGILALLGAAPAAVALGKQTPGADNNMLNRVGGAMGATSINPTREDPAVTGFYRNLWRHRERRNYRLDGYSADIHSMRSWSPGFKSLAQLQRDDAEKSTWKRLAAAVGMKDWEP